MGGGGKKLKNVVVIYITIDVETSEKTKHKTKIRFFKMTWSRIWQEIKKDCIVSNAKRREGEQGRELSDPKKKISSNMPKNEEKYCNRTGLSSLILQDL